MPVTSQSLYIGDFGSSLVANSAAAFCYRSLNDCHSYLSYQRPCNSSRLFSISHYRYRSDAEFSGSLMLLLCMVYHNPAGWNQSYAWL